MSISIDDRKSRHNLKIDNESIQGGDTSAEKGGHINYMDQSVSEETKKVSVFAAIDTAVYGDIDHLLFLLY